MGRHRASVTFGPRPQCKQDFKEKHKDKAQVPRKEDVSGGLLFRAPPRPTSFALGLRSSGSSPLYLPLEKFHYLSRFRCAKSVSSWFIGDLVGIKKENGRKRKQMSAKTNGYIYKPQIFFFLISNLPGVYLQPGWIGTV